MIDSFNPYSTFLGLDTELTNPNYYQLLRLRESETDPAKINAAADKAAAKIRSQQPGVHVYEWSQLLNEVKAARSCLLNPAHRAAYDAHLESDATDSDPQSEVGPAIKFVAAAKPAFAFPPGVGPGNSTGSSTPIRSELALPHADPMAPVAMPGNISHYTAAGYGSAAPFPSATAASSAIDPMAPVNFSEMVVASAPWVGQSGSEFGQLPSHGQQAYEAHPEESAYGTSTALAELGLPTKPKSYRRIARKPARIPTLLIGGTVGLVLLLVGLLVAWTMKQQKEMAENDASPVEPVSKTEIPSALPPGKLPGAVNPKPKPDPERPDPEPKRPDPAPEMKPEPEPESKPEPEPKPEPKPIPMPTPQELVELSRLMQDGRAALGDFTFDEATSALTQAEQLAKLPEHKAKVERLQRVAEFARQFRESIVETMKTLQSGDVIKVGTSTEAAIVESSAEEITIRIAGGNKTYALNELPLGLAVNLGERSLNADAPSTKVFKGAFVLIDKRSDKTHLAKARTWWEEALSSGEPIADLMEVFDDTYDFEDQ